MVYSHIWLETIVSVMCYGCVWKCMWDHRINLFWISNNAAKEDEKENEIEKDKKNKGKQGQTTSSFIHTQWLVFENDFVLLSYAILWHVPLTCFFKSLI